MILSQELLRECLPHSTNAKIDKFLQPINNTLIYYDIDTPERIAAFLAQVAHESWSLKYVEEIASGEAYEGRKDLGNTKKGDGIKYKGRGLLQITGRANYTALGKALNYDFINNPNDLCKPGAAAMSAGWFWNKRNLNDWADVNNFRKITKLVNGGYNGYEERCARWNETRSALNILY